MKIAVLNGSPKNDISVTMQYVAWMKKQFPQHEFNILHIAGRINRIEREPEAFNEIIETVKSSDLVLWAYPLYVMLVHADYKRFIELIYERNVQEAFKGKYAAQLATSIHFFDHTAIAYINGICDDLGMHTVGTLSAEMDDLLKEEKRSALKVFVDFAEKAVSEAMEFPRKFAPAVHQPIAFAPSAPADALSLQGKRAVILADGYDPTTNLGKMIDSFRARFSEPVDLVDLNDIAIKGGCLGCIQCGYDNQCIYGDRDDIIPLYEKLRTYDIVVYALEIRDRFFSARWKRFVDRRFYRTHQPMFSPNTLTAYLISGPLQQLPMLREIIEAGAQFDGAGLVGIATDEADLSETIDKNLNGLCQTLAYYAGSHVKMPQTFLGVAGAKLFRDEMWGNLRFVFVADHKYYKSHGFYDFPQKDYGVRIRNLLVMPLMGIPAARRWFQKNMKENMLRGYKGIV